MSTTVKSIIFIAVLALIGVGAFLLIDSSDDESIENTNNTSNSAQTDRSSNEINDATITYTVQEVASKNTEQECWTIIDGAVYDITSYIPRHPGGEEILLACGTDGSSLFNERQTNTGERIGSGTSHSSSASNQLNSLLIGLLEN